MRGSTKRFIASLSALVAIGAVAGSPSSARAAYPCPPQYSYCTDVCPGGLEGCAPEGCFSSMYCQYDPGNEYFPCNPSTPFLVTCYQ